MEKSHIENILTLLTLVILIDDRVYPEEVETFSDAAHRLCYNIDPGILFTSSMAADWFKANRASIHMRLHEESKGFVRKIIRSLTGFKKRKDVFFNMVQIAHSDKEYHTKEHIVIQLASEIWSIPYSVDESLIAG